MLLVGLAGFAELFGVHGHVEDVVLDLERQADGVAVGGQIARQLGVRAAGGQVAQGQAGGDQAAGFQVMHAFQGGHVLQLAVGGHVLHLPGGHAGAAGGLGERAHHADAGAVRVVAGAAEQLEGEGVQGVPGEDRGGFVEGAVAGGLAPAQVVVVHRRQVVVDQGVGVDQLHRHRRHVGLFQAAAGEPAGGVHQHRADPLAAGQGRVAHRFGEARGVAGRGVRQMVAQGLVEPRAHGGVERVQGVEVTGHRGLRKAPARLAGPAPAGCAPSAPPG